MCLREAEGKGVHHPFTWVAFWKLPGLLVKSEEFGITSFVCRDWTGRKGVLDSAFVCRYASFGFGNADGSFVGRKGHPPV